MNRSKLNKITSFLIRLLVRNGYTQKESGDLLIAIGNLIKEVRHENSKKIDRKEDSRLSVYNDRLSDL